MTCSGTNTPMTLRRPGLRRTDAAGCADSRHGETPSHRMSGRALSGTMPAASGAVKVVRRLFFQLALRLDFCSVWWHTRDADASVMRTADLWNAAVLGPLRRAWSTRERPVNRPAPHGKKRPGVETDVRPGCCSGLGNSPSAAPSWVGAGRRTRAPPCPLKAALRDTDRSVHTVRTCARMLGCGHTWSLRYAETAYLRELHVQDTLSAH